jgi:hypothetical protein
MHFWIQSLDGAVIPALREGLEKNSTLETLEWIRGGPLDRAYVTSFRIAAVEALQLNMTLKSLCIGDASPQYMADDEVKHLTSTVKKNYRLESLHYFDSDVWLGSLRFILRLSRAGPRYLLDGHGSVVSKGVSVLCAVSNNLDCIFLHLLENPLLCDGGSGEQVRASLKCVRVQ